MIIDTHAHIDRPQFKKDYKEVINSIDKIIIPAIETNNISKIIQLANNFKNVYFSIGEHPNSRNNFKKEILNEFYKHNKCVAIGECGLDWFRINKNISLEKEKERQKILFEKQIEFSIEFNLPLIVHTRGAEKEVVNILKKYKEAKGVIHGFNGNEELLNLINKNWYFGIGGMITYNKYKTKENLKKIPIDKILIETDSPFLTPLPKKGRNEPKYLKIIIEEISNQLKISSKEIEKITRNNALNLFRKLN
jgi:TatD DNase family protein